MMKYRKFSWFSLPVVMILAFSVSVLASSASASEIYEKVFNFECPGRNPEDGSGNWYFSNYDWYAYSSDSLVCSIIQPTPGSVPSEGGVSCLAGSDGTLGYPYTKPNSTHSSFIYTEAMDSLEQDATFSWIEKLDSTTSTSQLVIKIGPAWYVGSDEFTMTSSGVWGSFVNGSDTSGEVSISDITSWYLLTLDTGDPGSLAVDLTPTSLPAGSIVGTGLYFTTEGTSISTIRFDDFAIEGTIALVPEPGALALLLAGLVGLMAFKQKK